MRRRKIARSRIRIVYLRGLLGNRIPKGLDKELRGEKKGWFEHKERNNKSRIIKTVYEEQYIEVVQ